MNAHLLIIRRMVSLIVKVFQNPHPLGILNHYETPFIFISGGLLATSVCCKHPVQSGINTVIFKSLAIFPQRIHQRPEVSVKV